VASSRNVRLLALAATALGVATLLLGWREGRRHEPVDAERTVVFASARARDSRAIAEEAVRNHGALVLVASLEDAVDLANRLAPEHLELLVEVPAPPRSRRRPSRQPRLSAAMPSSVAVRVRSRTLRDGATPVLSGRDR